MYSTDNDFTSAFLQGLQMGSAARQRRDEQAAMPKMLDLLTGFNPDVKQTQTNVIDQASRSNPNSNYMNKTAETQATNNLMPAGFQTNVPASSDISLKSLLPQAPQQPQQTFFNMPQYQAGTDNQGLIQQGNIDIANRPTLRNADGSISTVRSMGINADGKEVLIPTVGPKGEDWTKQQAVDSYKQTGQNLGTFDSPETSDQYAQSLHEQQAKQYLGKQPSGIMGQYSQENNPAAVQTKTLDWSGMENEYNNAWARKIRETFTGMPAKVIREYLPHVMAAKDEQFKLMKSNYDEQQRNEGWNKLKSISDPKQKIALAIDYKLPMESVNLLMKPDTVVEFRDTGDGYLPVSKNIYTNELINLNTGKPLVGTDLQKKLSPAQQQAQNNWERDYAQKQEFHYNPVYKSGGGSGGGSAGGTEDILTKEQKTMLGKAQTIQSSFRSKYFDTLTNQWRDGYQSDPMYQAYRDAVETENKLMSKYANSFRQEAKDAGVLGDVVPDTGDQRIDGMIAAMRAKGASEKMINDMVWEETNKPAPTPRQSRVQSGNISDQDYLGIPVD